MPSMAAHFIANLPEGDEAERAAYERVAKDVCAVAYGGESVCLSHFLMLSFCIHAR